MLEPIVVTPEDEARLTAPDTPSPPLTSRVTFGDAVPIPTRSLSLSTTNVSVLTVKSSPVEPPNEKLIPPACASSSIASEPVPAEII